MMERGFLFFNHPRVEPPPVVTYFINSERIIYTATTDKTTIEDNLICLICQGVLYQPLECRSCQRAFCRACIQEWQRRTSRCPLKCAELDLASPHFITQSLLEKLRLRCHNFAQGCDFAGEYHASLEHERTCAFETVRCKAYSNCKREGLRRDIEKHEEKCDYMMLTCSKCKKEHFRKYTQRHKDECEMESVRCKAFDFCLSEDVRREIKKHEQLCAFIDIRCPKCMKRMKRKDMEAHDCVAYLKSLIEEEKTKNQALAEEIEKVDAEIKKQKNYVMSHGFLIIFATLFMITSYFGVLWYFRYQ